MSVITEIEYTGNGIQTDFTIPFSYIYPEFVKASINGVATSAFNLFNDTTIRFSSAPAIGEVVRIFRDTDDDALLVDFNAGAAIREMDLETAFTQVLNITQEAVGEISQSEAGQLAAAVEEATNTANAALTAALNVAAGSKVFCQATPPLLPNVGSLWWDTTVGKLYVYFQDVDSAQWVEASPLIQGGTFLQAGTGAFARTLESKLRDTVSLRDFGATGNGVTDDSAAIQAALNSGARRIDGQSLTYKVNNRLTINSNTTLENCVFDMTGVPTGTGSQEIALSATGSLGASQYNLTANALIASGTSPSISLSPTDAANFAPGDIFIIRSNELFTPTMFVSELATVMRVSSGTIFLQAPLTYGYTVANNARIQKINPKENITLRNITANGPSPLSGSTQKVGFFGATYVRNVRVEDCTITNFNRSGVEFRQARDCWMQDCVVTNIVDYYGVLVADGASYIYIDGNSFENTRHGISVGGSNALGGGVCNFLFFTNNVSTSLDAALDTHPPADNVIFANNICRCKGGTTSPNGIIHQGRNIVVSGNLITGFAGNGITVQPYYVANYPATISVTGNNITCDRTDASSAGIYVQTSEPNSGTATCVPKGINIAGNIIEGTFDTGGIYIKAEANAVPLNDITITGNTVSQSPTPINIRSTGANVNGVSITGNSVSQATTGISLRPDNSGDTINGVAITGNSFRSVTTAINKVGSGTNRNIAISGNSFDGVTTILGTALTSTTIAAGVVTLNGSFGRHLIDTEAAAATDDLGTINGGFTSMIATFTSVNAARDVVFKDGGGNLRLNGDFTATSSEDSITLLFNGTNWIEVSRSDNSV